MTFIPEETKIRAAQIEFQSRMMEALEELIKKKRMLELGNENFDKLTWIFGPFERKLTADQLILMREWVSSFEIDDGHRTDKLLAEAA